LSSVYWVFVGTNVLSQTPSGCWRTSATTTRLQWPSHRLGYFRQWARTTQRGWTVWTTYKSCFYLRFR
jgi:hypothetical protein